jgi:hypothetical protein
MKSLVVMKFDPEKDCQISNGLLKGITELDACTYLVPDSLNWDRSLFRFRGSFLGEKLKRSLRSSWQS